MENSTITPPLSMAKRSRSISTASGLLPTGKAKGPLNKTGAPFRLSNSCCGGRSFVGAIDEMRVSNTARSEKEIRTLMELGIEGFLAVDSKGKLTTTWGEIRSQ